MPSVLRSGWRLLLVHGLLDGVGPRRHLPGAGVRPPQLQKDNACALHLAAGGLESECK